MTLPDPFLELVPIPLKPLPRTFALPGFWQGCAETRRALMRSEGSVADLGHQRAIARYERLAELVHKGERPSSLPEFRLWLRGPGAQEQP